MIKVQVEAATKQPRTYNNETFYSIKSGNKWISIHGLGDRKPVKGEVLTVDEVRETVSDSGRSFYDATVVQQTATPTEAQARIEKWTEEKVEELVKLTRTTPFTQPLSQWEQVVDAGMRLAQKYGVVDDGARVSLVACLTIPFGEGKLSLDNDGVGSLLPGQEPMTPYQRQKSTWPDADLGLPPKPENERGLAHTELEARCEEYGTMCSPVKLPKDILFGVSGTREVLELSEKEAIAARLKVESLIDGQADWKTKLLLSIKECCKVKGIDFNSQKYEILWACCKTRSDKDLDQLTAKRGLQVLKEKYWPEMP